VNMNFNECVNGIPIVPYGIIISKLDKNTFIKKIIFYKCYV